MQHEHQDVEHSATAADLGWAGPTPDDPEVVALRRHLEANGGIVGLEILEPHEIERAVQLFDRDGFVVIRDALTPEHHHQSPSRRSSCCP